jgi:hypothetical protein
MLVALIDIFVIKLFSYDLKDHTFQGRIQDFKLGGAHLKKLRRAEGGAKIFGAPSKIIKKYDFLA